MRALQKIKFGDGASRKTLFEQIQEDHLNENFRLLFEEISEAVHKAVVSVTLSASWSGSGPYTQTVTVSGYTVTANSKVDLQPDATTIAQLITDGVSALYIVNNNGTLTAYAVGTAPTAALTVQATITEVTV